MWRWLSRLFAIDHGYGPSKYRDFDGAGWPEFVRRCRATRLSVRDQVPTSRFPKPDDARLRAKECVTRLKIVHRRRA